MCNSSHIFVTISLLMKLYVLNWIWLGSFVHKTYVNCESFKRELSKACTSRITFGDFLAMFVIVLSLDLHELSTSLVFLFFSCF